MLPAMNRSVLIGVFCAMSGAVTYGLNPFFAIPMYEHWDYANECTFLPFLDCMFLVRPRYALPSGIIQASFSILGSCVHGRGASGSFLCFLVHDI